MFSRTVTGTGDMKPTYKQPTIDARINIIRDKIILRASRDTEHCVNDLSIKQINRIATMAAYEAVHYIKNNYDKSDENNKI